MSYRPTPTGREVTFDPSEVIVSKTTPTGIITYANDVFLRVAGYTEDEIIGQPHSIIRHPAMPRCVFRLLWDTIGQGQEIFAYVINLAKNGDHYWVFAHVTPDIDPRDGSIRGYHSSRRVASKGAVAEISALYGRLTAEEQGHHTKAAAIDAGLAAVTAVLKQRGQTYEQFVFDLYHRHAIVQSTARHAA